MCKIVTTEYNKLDPALNEFIRGGSPSVSDIVIKRITNLYDALPRGAEIGVVITKEDQTYVQVSNRDGAVIEHFHHVFAYGDKNNPGQIALLDLIDGLMGNVTEAERKEFEDAKERVKHSQAFCLSLKFKK